MRRNDNTMRIARQGATYRLTLMGIRPPRNRPDSDNAADALAILHWAIDREDA